MESKVGIKKNQGKRLRSEIVPEILISWKKEPRESVNPEFYSRKPSQRRRMRGIRCSPEVGGASIPPANLRVMLEQITDENSLAYQRMS